MLAPASLWEAGFFYTLRWFMMCYASIFNQFLGVVVWGKDQGMDASSL
jgi:hypothetical protein